MQHWDELRVFLAVYRAGSCAAASRGLGINQSTVSRRLAALEAELGVRLFERVPGGLLPTPAAEAVLSQAELIESATHQLSSEVAGLDTALTGTVRVAMPEQIALELVAPALPEFFAEYPGLRLELVAGPVVRDLTRREADMALRFVRPSSGDLLVEKVATVTFGVFGHRDYLDRHVGASPDELSWVDWDTDLSHLPDAVWRRRAYPMVEPVLRASSLAIRMRAVLAGVGVSVLATPLAMRYPELRSVAVKSEVPSADMWLVQHSASRRLPRIRKVRELLHRLTSSMSDPV